MSAVTSVILSMSVAEDGFGSDGDCSKIDELNAWLATNCKQPLEYLSHAMIKGKHPETHTFGGGYNYFPRDEFLEYVKSIDWECPGNVVLVMQPEDGDTLVWRPIKSSSQ